MQQKPKSSQKSSKGETPGPTAPATPSKPRDKTASVELIGFTPTLAVEGAQPASKSDAAALARRRVRRWTIALGVLAFLSVVVLLGPGFYRSFKAWRATQLALKSEELIRKNQIDEALPTIRSAFILSPKAPEVERATAQMLTLFNAPEAVTYWNWVLQSGEATDDDRRAAADCAMQNNLFNEASTLIQDLLTRDGKDARNQLLAARWCIQRGSPDQTMIYATRAVNDDPDNKSAVLFLAIQQLTNTYLHQDGVNSLLKLASSDDDSGLTALRHLSLDSNLKPDDIDRVIARLRSHPLAAEPERIAYLTLEIERNPGKRQALIDQAAAAHQKAAPADMAAFAEWLINHGEAARVLKLIPRERALSNKDIFAAYIDALGGLKRWADLKDLLTGAAVPLEIPYVELYLSRCSSEMGDEQSAELHWRNAVSSAAYNPAQSMHLARYAEKLGQNERAAAVYRTLTEEPVTAYTAYLGLLRVLGDKDARTLRDLLQQMVVRWPSDDEMGTQFIFYNLLLDEHPEEMRLRALKLLTNDSFSVAHCTNVALACLRLNNPAGAMRAYQNAEIHWKASTAPDVVVFAATLDANGQHQKAHTLLVPVNRHALRPELRDLIKSIP